MNNDLYEKALKAATKGRWAVYYGTCRVGELRSGQYVHGADPYADLVCSNVLQADAEFIAAANPQAILELYAELERLRALVRHAYV